MKERHESCVPRSKEIRLYAHFSHEYSLSADSKTVEKLNEESLMLLMDNVNIKAIFKMTKHLQRNRKLLSQKNYGQTDQKFS